MSLFSIAIMINSQSLIVYLKISKVVENSYSTQVRQQYLRCNYTTFKLKIQIFFWVCAKFSKSINCCGFTIGMKVNETGYLQNCVKLFGKFINKNET